MGLDITGCADHVTTFAENTGPMFCPWTTEPPQREHTIGGRLFEDLVLLGRALRLARFIGSDAHIKQRTEVGRIQAGGRERD